MEEGAKAVNAVFVGVLSALCLSLLVTVALRYTHVIPLNEVSLGNEEQAKAASTRILSGYETLFENMKVKLTNISNKQFPYYIDILEANTALGKTLSTGLYNTVFPGDYRFVPLKTSTGLRIFTLGDNRLIHVPAEPFSEEAVQKSAALYSDVARRHPELNVCMYTVPEPFSAGIMGRESFLFEDWPNRAEQLVDALDASVSGGWLRYRSLDEYDRYIFKSDHHWNYTGAYQGYLDVLELLGRKDAGIGAPLEWQMKRSAAAEFFGSYARLAAYDHVADEVYDADIELPAHEVAFLHQDGTVTRGDTVSPNREAYLSGEKSVLKYQNLYADFFRNDYALVTYTYPQNRGRNLLVLADSVSNCMEEVLASHYDKTFCVDLRLNHGFSFDAFVAENGITDVIFLYASQAFGISAYSGQLAAGP